MIFQSSVQSGNQTDHSIGKLSTNMAASGGAGDLIDIGDEITVEATMTTFCVTPLWDSNLTWYTDDPDFTPCFHKTILVYVPCLFLWLTAMFDQMENWNSLHRDCPWSWVNIGKLSTTGILCILATAEIVIDAVLINEVFIVGADFVGSGIKLVTYLLAFALIWNARKAGRVSSIIQSLFWFLIAVCQGFTFGSVANHDLLGLSWTTAQDVLYILGWILIMINFLLFCVADYPPRYSDIKDQTQNPSPELTSTPASRILFLWFDKTVWKGLRKTISAVDLWDLNTKDSVRWVVPTWEKYWGEAIEAAKQKQGGKAGIFWVLVKSFWPTFLLGALYQFVYVGLQFASPQILGLIISFVQGDDPDWKGYFYTILFAIVAFLSAISDSSYWYNLRLVGLRLRTALSSAIYKKSLRLSNNSRKAQTAGEIVNLISVDSQKIEDACLFFNMMWSCPLQVGLAVFFLYQEIGVSVFVGLAVLLIMLPLNAIIWSIMEKYQYGQMKKKDERVRLITEILNGIKVIKLYGWELSFVKRINQLREEEVEQLKIFQFLEASQFFAWTSAPFMVALASFATFVLIDPVNNILDSQTAFVSLTLFNTMRGPLFLLPFGIVSIIQGMVSMGRINHYLNLEELNPDNVTHWDDRKHPVELKKASFSWNDDAKLDGCTIKDISWHVEEGALVAVVGTVGSGKSSLLSALLGDMIRVQGEANTKGKVAYVPQQAWMQNATLKNNILFGRDYKRDLYEKVIDACALRTDLDILTGGDETEIGEKGINVSGGQKQRISLARSVYNNADVYLLDDPLSAVDSNVGKHIFEKVIGPRGVLKRKTRVLVTHGISFLPLVDQIVVMDDGQISEIGTYEELMANKGAFAEFLIEQLQAQEEQNDNDSDEAGETNAILSEAERDDLKQQLEDSLGKSNLMNKMAVQARRKRQMENTKRVKTYSMGSIDDPNELASLSDVESVFSLSSVTVNNVRPKKTSTTLKPPLLKQQSSVASKRSDRDSARKPKEEDDSVFKIGRDLIEDEATAENRVKLEIYVYYAKAIGMLLAFLSFLFYFLFQLFTVGGNLWLSVWSEDERASTDTSVRNLYLGIYGLLGFLQALFILIAVIVITIGTLRASIKLHTEMLAKILSSTMAFFDTTPVGRIINRFSKDMDEVDLMIPTHIKDILSDMFSVLGTVFVVCFATPIIIAVVIPLIILFWFIQSSYLATSRQLKRMINVTRSPINSSLTESLGGATTIRAYKMQNDFIHENEQRIERHQMCYYPEIASNSWLFCRLEGLASILIIFASLFAIVYRDSVNPGLVGLSLTYALTLQLDMFLLTRYVAELEKSVVSVERIKEYQDTPQEAAFEVSGFDPPPGWPHRGEIVFQDYATRYREGMDLVLRGVSFHIGSTQKVGIVGRTGAGKSSLTLSLFRIIEAAQGSISIDGLNIGQMGLGRLREALTIIPQDPVLFSGTMRTNLDPFNKYSDVELWRTLDHAHLKGFVAKLPGGLDYPVVEGGENLSVGQRQLVCLARALLRKTKILVLDEATAAVDLETDDLIQATIRSEFADCTVLTIAHRLKTIMDSDVILLLEAGLVKEFDSPENLLDDPNSAFYSMAEDAGLVSSYL